MIYTSKQTFKKRFFSLYLDRIICYKDEKKLSKPKVIENRVTKIEFYNNLI